MATSPTPRLPELEASLELPRQNGDLVFAAPWEARAFGLAVALKDAGVYPWRDFSQGLATETAAADRGDTALGYYERWLETLTKLALDKGLITPEELATRMQAYALEESAEHADHAPAPPSPTASPGETWLCPPAGGHPDACKG